MVDEEDIFTEKRKRMVDEQLSRRDIVDERILEVMRQIPRHRFVLPEYREYAYADGPLSIGLGQTISQPYIVALMTQILELQGTETVLEVGTGSGYQAAVLAALAKYVFSIEQQASLAKRASSILKSIGITNVEIVIADGSLGLPEKAPFDGIIVTAAAPKAPRPLLEQMADGARMVLPVGRRWEQVLQLWQCIGNDFIQETIIPVAFVPLRGRYGWDSTAWMEDI